MLFNKLFKRNTPKQLQPAIFELKVDSPNNKNNIFRNGLKNSKSIKDNTIKGKPIIETLECVNGGLGFQKIKK